MTLKGLLLTVIAISIALTPSSAFTLKYHFNFPRGINIDNDPAPSPEDGPPLSANASRNRALIPYQVAGIVGSYLLTLLIIGTALLLVGRRLRKEALRTKKADVELVQPTISGKHFYPSPVSPTGPPQTPNFSWPSPTVEKKPPNPYVFPSGSPLSTHGNEAFDQRVLEADRDLLARNLEDIYAHVMEHEEAKAAGITLADPVIPRTLKPAAPAPAENPQRSKMAKGRRPSELSTEGKLEKTHSRASSLISSLKSPKSEKRRGIRSLKISSPIPTPLSAAFPQSDEEPLSPRYYTPPPPPPVPGQASTTHSRQNSTDPSPASPVRSLNEQFANVSLDTASRDYGYGHRYNQSYSSVRSSRERISATSQTPLYPQKQPKSLPKIQVQVPGTKATQSSPTNSLSLQQPSYGGSRPLPFRAYEPSINSNVSQTTKTTVLERTTPLSPGLRTPFTAGAVPYSPYQPFTPIMPITPRLVTRQEMKMKKKEEAKKPALEMIKGDDELWDSGW